MPSDIDRLLVEYTNRRLDEEAARQGVPRELARRLIGAESGGDADVISGRKLSRAGAIGPMQLMPGTAKDLGVDPYHVDQNVEGGVRYLKRQLHSFGGDQVKAAAAYNAGPGNVRKYDGVPPFKETQDYVRQVTVSDQGSEIDRLYEQFTGERPAQAPKSKPQTRRERIQDLKRTLNRVEIPEGKALKTSTGELIDASQMSKPAAPAAPGGVRGAVNQFLQSAIKNLAAIPEGFAENVRALPRNDEIDVFNLMIEEGKTPEEAQRELPARLAQYQAQRSRNLAIKQDFRPITERGAEIAERVAPVDPTDRGFFSAKVPQALGSTVPFIAGTVLSGGNPLAGAVLGASANAQQIAREFDEAGVDPAKRDRAIFFAGATGLTEIFGISRALNRFGLGRAFIKRIGDIVEEAGQEGLQQYLNNVNAAMVGAYDPDRPLDQGVIESAVLGGIVGGGMQGASAVASRIAPRVQSAPSPAVAPAPAPVAASVAPAPSQPPVQPTPQPTQAPAPLPAQPARPTTLDYDREGALEVAGKEGWISPALLQRRLKIGYGRAAAVMDRLEQEGWRREGGRLVPSAPTEQPAQQQVEESATEPLTDEIAPALSPEVPRATAELARPQAVAAPAVAPAELRAETPAAPTPKPTKAEQTAQERVRRSMAGVRIAQKYRQQAETARAAGDLGAAQDAHGTELKTLKDALGLLPKTEIGKRSQLNNAIAQAQRLLGSVGNEIKSRKGQAKAQPQTPASRQAQALPVVDENAPTTGVAPDVPPTSRDLAAPIVEEPTNRITEGEGAELPRRVSRPLEGQPTAMPAPRLPRSRTERLSVPKATPENIETLRARREELSRLAYDRRGDFTGDLRDELRELGAQIIEFENAQAKIERGGRLEDAPLLGARPERMAPPTEELPARRAALDPKTGFASREDERQARFDQLTDDDLVAEVGRLEDERNKGIRGISKLTPEELEANNLDLQIAIEAQKERGRIQRAQGRGPAERIAPRTPGRPARKTPEARQEETPTVTHPNPALDRKPILAETGRGTVIIPNPSNKTGVSEVKDRSGEKSDYKFSSTQVNLPKEVGDKLMEFGKRIPDADLADDGRETEPHITVKFGLHGADPKFAREALKGEGPIKVKFGKVSLFDTNPDFDVIKVDIESPDLHRLNKLVAESQPVTDTHPAYKPHATIAYVQKGKGAKYVGDSVLEGQEVTLDSVMFSGRDGEKVEIPLVGEAEAQDGPKTEAPARKFKVEDIPQAAPKDLDATSRAIETRFREYLANNFDEAVKRYRKKFGKEINTDNARELSADYAKSDEARSLYSPAVHEPSSWFAKELYKIMLAEKPGKGDDTMVLFTAGGTGAGKTSTLATSEKMATAVDRSQVIMDGNLNNAKKAIQKIDQALAAGKTVKIAAVYRDPVEAWRNGVLPRAEKKGRAVPVDIHVETHSQMRDALVDLADHYADDPRVEIGFIDNTHGKDKARDSNIAVFREISDTEALRKQLVKETKEAYDNGEISQRVYAGSLGGREVAPGAEEVGRGARVGERPGRTTELQPDARRERRPQDSARLSAGRGAEGRGGSILESPPAGRRAARGEQASLKIPRTDKEYSIRYEVRELADVQPSHDPHTFQKNPKYSLVNDRDYTSPANRVDVEEATKAGKFDPRLVLSDDPTATNGPPVIAARGDVLGGNSRTMMLARAYKNHPTEGQKYKEALKKRAGMFGLNPATLDGFKEPVLVRVVDPEPENLQKLITDLNIQPGKAMSSTEAASARSRQMPAATMQYLADRLAVEGPDGTLAQALEGAKGVRILNRLIEDDVIPKGERNRYLTDQGNLTQTAKQEIETMLLGRLFRDADQMKATQPEMRNKLARIAPHLVKMSGTEWNISKMIPNAIEAAQASKNQKIDLQQLNQRGFLFGEGVQFSPEELAIAGLLKDSGPRQVENVFRRYAAEFEQAQMGQGLFGDPPTQKEAFDDVFQPERGKAPASSQGAFFGSGLGALQPLFERGQKPKEPARGQQPLFENKPKMGAKQVGRAALQVATLPRALMASADLSAPLRQGAILTLPPSQWGRAAQSGVRMIQSLKTSEYNRLVEELNNHPDARLGKAVGLDMVTDPKRDRKEEDFQSDLAERIPLGVGRVVRASRQAYEMYLDSLRLETFRRYKRAIDSDKRLDLEQKEKAYKAAAEWINIASGRGSLGKKFDKALPALSTVFFAPRYTASRIQVLNPLTYAKNSTTAAGRAVLKQQMSDLVQFAGVVSATLALAAVAGAEVGLDPEEPDFLKIKVGNTRYDMLAGLQQLMRLYYRVGKDIGLAAVGEKAEGPNAADALIKFARQKAAPIPSFFWDMVSRKDAIGRKFEYDRAIVERVTPLMWRDFYEAYQREGIGGAAKLAPGFLGVGAQDYEKRPGYLNLGGKLDAELRKHGLDYNRVSEIPGDTEKTHRARGEKVERWLKQYGGALVASPRYKSLKEPRQKAALETLRRRIGTEANNRLPNLSKFAAHDIVRSTLESERERPSRNRRKIVVAAE